MENTSTDESPLKRVKFITPVPQHHKPSLKGRWCQQEQRVEHYTNIWDTMKLVSHHTCFSSVFLYYYVDAQGILYQ